MSSHGRRLQFMQQTRSGKAPSIISGGGSSTGMSASVLSGPSNINKPMLTTTTGPCSSLISSRMQNQKNYQESQLSVASLQMRPLASSKSLGGSRASMVSMKSGKSTIQQEFHDIKVKRKLNALSYGRASAPFRYFLICISLAGLLMLIGLVIIYLRHYGELFLSLDKSEAIGPCLIVASVIFIGISIKFLVDSYRLGAVERRRLGFRATGHNMVTVRDINKPQDRPMSHGEYLVTGSTSTKAISKVPQMINRPYGGSESVLT